MLETASQLVVMLGSGRMYCTRDESFCWYFDTDGNITIEMYWEKDGDILCTPGI